MTQEEENQHIKKLKDEGFDCGTSRSILETIQLLKLSKEQLGKFNKNKQQCYWQITSD